MHAAVSLLRGVVEAVDPEPAPETAWPWPQAIVDYLRSYNVTPPQPGPWKPSPVPEVGHLHGIYWLCDRYQRVGAVPSVADCQRELLTAGVLSIAWTQARERAMADGGAVILERADTVGAVQTVFACEDAVELAGPLWADAAAWVLGWREAGRRDAELLERMGFGEPELRLLDGDAP
jgi:hypothetical protein